MDLILRPINYFATLAGAARGLSSFMSTSLYYFVAMLLMFVGMFITEYGRARARQRPEARDARWRID